jgi:hypothetical protein
MDYADYNQLNEVFTQTLWMVCKAGALIFGGLSLGSLAMCVGGLAWQCLVDAQDALRRPTPRRARSRQRGAPTFTQPQTPHLATPRLATFNRS